MKTVINACVLVFIVALMASCGGGGGGSQVADANPPVLVVRSVTGSSITTNQSVLPVIGTTTPTATVTVNGNAVAVDSSGNFSTSVTLSAGANTVSVIATLNSMQSAIQFTATLLQTPPSLTVISPPAALSTNNPSLVVNGTTEAAGVEVSVNGTLQTVNNGSFTTNVSLSSGANLVRIVAVDAAGNETVVERTVVLDQSSPFLAISSPVDGSTTYREPLVVSGETEAGASVTVNGLPVTLGSSGGALPSFSQTLSTYEASSTVVVVATDAAGNSTTTTLTVNRAAAPGTIYVANTTTLAADSPSCGTPDQPCLTIAQGIARAMATSAPQVFVASGIYLEQVVLAPGVDLLGGFDDTFTMRNLSTLKAEIWGDGTSRSVVADTITSPTLLEGFLIRGPVMATPSSNSAALYIKDSDSSLVVQYNTIVGGLGAPGTNGVAGISGANGITGAAGVAGVDSGMAPCVPGNLSPGGAGGIMVAGVSNLSGGNGGRNIACPDGNTIEVSAGSGISGQPAGGFGGNAGDDGVLTVLGCTLPAAATVGGDGAIGADGAPGVATASAGAGSIINHTWVGSAGLDGSSGANGSGGGGGGAGGGAKCSSGTCTSDTLGGTGGGGGSGGEAGQGGTGGTAGGASFGVFASFSSTPITLPVIAWNTVYLGIAGNGGAGGDGGIGGAGGTGGSGGAAGSSGFCTWAGGYGGKGGKGGHGAGGGGGAGGIASGFYLNLAGYAGVYDYDIANTITLSTGKAGVGGSGGLSLGDTGFSGANGSLSTIVVNP